TSNAATLWQWISAGDGDVVITDVVMPDENGLDLIPRIRKLRPNLRVIVMSAQNTLLTAVKATERGAFEYLPKPFDLRELVAVTVAASPRELIESELFGHEKGAFTGALARTTGRFEQATGGTLFLDEIGDMPPEAQTRLLRVLQQGEYNTVGGRAPLKVDVRI